MYIYVCKYTGIYTIYWYNGVMDNIYRRYGGIYRSNSCDNHQLSHSAGVQSKLIIFLYFFQDPCNVLRHSSKK